MRTDELSFWAWLLYPSSKLVELGVPAESVVDLRFAATGHLRAASVEWVNAFFMWGGVESAETIADATSHTPAQVRQHAKDAGLRYSTRDRKRTHAELALRMWCDRDCTPTQACTHFGVPPGARRILCSAAQLIIDAADGGLKEVLGWNVGLLERRFADLRLDLRPPRSVLVGVPGVRPEALRMAS